MVPTRGPRPEVEVAGLDVKGPHEEVEIAVSTQLGRGDPQHVAVALHHEQSLAVRVHARVAGTVGDGGRKKPL